ncbi:hypothetical protein SAMN05444266_104393 [Chitinophaga jiangningensis]|uniref:Uncharacterized protein n=1 Tax=Chitinophaga jiangningensis TaxID=1419482 RepID=A0A1M7CMM4_9BACT|nr:hypothetical protein [Chitinophaga jiangningensis]SHL68445.1 hypothetical protein SAMN05444266_104393 [Chitinophaga jiangningensis]
MQKILLFICAALLLVSCSPSTYKPCPCDTKDVYLRAYQDIIVELVEQKLNWYYLGEYSDELEKKYFGHTLYEEADWEGLKEDMIKAQHKLYNDSARFVDLYLDTLKPHLNAEVFMKEEYPKNLDTLKYYFQEFPHTTQEIIDSLNTSQTDYQPSDFKLCTFRMQPLGATIDTSKPWIGKLRLSKLVLDKAQRKGLLYYSFRCGRTCGRDALLLITNDGTTWKIDYVIMQSVN